MVSEGHNCTLADREGLMVSYLAGTLPADKAEAFEAHYFGCDECWRELQQVLEIRSAALPETPVRKEIAVPAARRMDWRWLAAAASVVLVVSVWRLSQQPPTSSDDGAPAPAATTSPVPTSGLAPAPSTTVSPTPAIAPPARSGAPPRPRGAGDQTLRAPGRGAAPASVVRETDGDIRLEWAAVEKAASYRLTVWAKDATELLKLDTETPSILISAATVAVLGRADEPLVAVIEALDAQGVTLSQSPRIPIPARRKKASR